MTRIERIALLPFLIGLAALFLIWPMLAQLGVSRGGVASVLFGIGSNMAVLWALLCGLWFYYLRYLWIEADPYAFALYPPAAEHSYFRWTQALWVLVFALAPITSVRFFLQSARLYGCTFAKQCQLFGIDMSGYFTAGSMISASQATVGKAATPRSAKKLSSTGIRLLSGGAELFTATSTTPALTIPGADLPPPPFTAGVAQLSARIGPGPETRLQIP